jgi:hypothetical protein
MRRLAVALATLTVLAGSAGRAGAASPDPFQQDPMGPIKDVTAHWQRYQPAATFCVKPDTVEGSTSMPPPFGRQTPTTTGANPACRHSGFSLGTKGLFVVHVRTPILCAGCRRLFIDFSRIPRKNSPPTWYAHGHVYFHLDSANPSYTVDPIAHSPNTKNFTNDKLFVPDGSPWEPLVYGQDLHSMSYVSDTAHFVESASQGPYYVGPWYVNRAGQRIEGVYFDVDVNDAAESPFPPQNGIGYIAGFNADDGSCPTGDDDGYYAGCADHWGHSSRMVDPFHQ